MNDIIRQDLARALGVEAGRIRAYRRQGEGYDVILDDYRKLTAVSRLTVPGIPAHLQEAYARPEASRLPVLRELAALLDVPRPEQMAKRALIAAINAAKAARPAAPPEETTP